MKSIFSIFLYNCLFGLSVFSFTNIKAQIASPLILNVGGGYSSNLDWNIGEHASIAFFISSNGLSLNTGFLQPSIHSVSNVDDPGFFTFADQLSLGPNPTSNLLHVKAPFKELGNCSIQLVDARSNILLIKEIRQSADAYETDIYLEKYHAGIYYLKVFFKPNIGVLKSMIYKIIKL